MRKSGQEFDRTMDRLRELGIPQLAARYTHVFQRIMEFELLALGNPVQNPFPLTCHDLRYTDTLDGGAAN